MTSTFLLDGNNVIKNTVKLRIYQEKAKELFIRKNIHVKDDMRFLIYALMIYENYKRPSIFRQLDYFRYQFDHIPKKQGIMQIDSKKILSDVESIELIEKKLERLQQQKKAKKNMINSSDLLKGLGKKKEEIVQIEGVYQYLKEFSEL